MKAKLIKTDSNNFVLETNNGFLSGTLEPSSFEYKLSLKNCQAIERGYDLDELADEFCKEYDTLPVVRYNTFKAGFETALDLIGDKKFSEEDLRLAMHFGRFGEANNQTTTIGFIQSLQQTEWDVEVEIEGFVDEEGIYCGERPKFDVDGCLILKRI